MKKIIIFIPIIILSALIINSYQLEKLNQRQNITMSKSNFLVHNSAISMMYETTFSSGEYAQSNDNSWPIDSYVFNETLSKCENGGTLTWDNTNKKVLMSSNVSDKCYVYFDKLPPTIGSICSGQNMATCIKDNYELDSSILLHNSSLANSADDGSYRYTGASESVNNYVCFGSNAETCPTDNLYRIIGVFENNVKLIKYDYALLTLLGKSGYGVSYSGSGVYKSTYKGSQTSADWFYWHSQSKNIWSESSLNTQDLNTNFINNIGSDWANKITTTTWKIGENLDTNIYNVVVSIAYQNEIVSPETSLTATSKIGLLYSSDYGYAASQENWTTKLCDYDNDTNRNNNWIYMGENEWTMTRSYEDPDHALIPNGVGMVGNNGNVFHNGSTVSYIGVRPVFYLNTSVVLKSGNGTYSNPYRIS